ncbi:MAG: ABC transporter ATP-binding protein [Dehalococcoidales bacterium]|nr:ABC transporter ATP-binding protein [Dehalococcoidales bacterium]
MLEVRLKRKLQGFTLDVAFKVDQEILAILGPSGSGKTMTLQCISGLVRPDEGYVSLNGTVLLDTSKKINLPARQRRVGFVFQNYALFPHLTVSQNVGYGIRHLPPDEIKEKITNLLGKMNIPHLSDRFPRQLSAGQQQRVAVARALAPEPEVLLLDEPFSALDSLVKERLQLELQALHEFYKGIILFVTHDLTEGYKFSSKIAVFESGNIVQHDDKERVITCPSNHTVARLVGFKNLMEGSVTKVQNNVATIEVPELGGAILAKVSNASRLMPSQRVTVGIRPEYVQLRKEAGENTLYCTMDRIAEGVSATNCYFHVNTVGVTRHYLMVILSRPDSGVIKEGQKSHLYLPPEHVVVITN